MLRRVIHTWYLLHWDVDPHCICSWLQSIFYYMDPLCIVRGHVCFIMLHGSAVYLFWRPCSHWAWVCPPQGWFGFNILLKLQVVLRSRGSPNSTSLRCLIQNLFVMNFGHHLPFWPHSLGGICYSWNGPLIISLQKFLLTDLIFFISMLTRAF
jgi:hypothetical protein